MAIKMCNDREDRLYLCNRNGRSNAMFPYQTVMGGTGTVCPYDPAIRRPRICRASWMSPDLTSRCIGFIGGTWLVEVGRSH